MTTSIRSDATSSTIVVNGVDQVTIKDTGVVTARTKGASGNDVVVMSQITGTVSQTAGVPTGAIIETGSNANGTYIKWADGTLIQRLRNSPSVTITTAYGSGFYGSTSWTYPIAFAGANTDVSVTMHGQGASRITTSCMTSITTTASTFYLLDTGGGSVTQVYNCTWVAIGRWF